jgi:deoxyribonuclease (pyrimidine dimer)
MVRINLINPESLTDQHLIAEYNEILMLLGYVRKYSDFENIPKKYLLGKGHIRFFKNKLIYLQRRHTAIKEEMMHRGFDTNKTILLDEFPKELQNDWRPNQSDAIIIKERLIEKLNKKTDFYRYYGDKKDNQFLIKLIVEADLYP